MTDPENPGTNSDERDDTAADPETDPIAEGGPAADDPAERPGADRGPGAEVGMSDEPNTFEPEEDPDAEK